MRNGICPECGSSNVYTNIGSAQGAAGGREANLLYIAGGSPTDAAELDVYVCGDCGAIRTFVSDEDALQRITEKWARLNA